jgi:excisionase family DNA binding protein
MEDRLLTVQELVEFIPWQEGFVYQMVSDGTLPFNTYKLGRKRVFRMSEVQQFIEGLEPEEPEDQAKSLGRL